MQQVKIFKNVETNVSELEKEINAWIARSDAQIISITGNIAPQSDASGKGGLSNSAFPPSDVVVIVLYEAAT